jgi:hypothetical protein
LRRVGANDIRILAKMSFAAELDESRRIALLVCR